MTNLILSKLGEKELSRKEFLAVCGLGVVAMLGLSSIVRAVTGRSLELSGPSKPKDQDGGYGSVPYGK